MDKLKSDISWFSLSKDGLNLPMSEEKEQIFYPSSAKTKKNWDKIGKEIES